MMVFLKKDRSFPVQIEKKCVKEFVIFGNVKPKYNSVKLGILKVIIGLENDSIVVQYLRHRDKCPCTKSN
jgi:hypothetical protein